MSEKINSEKYRCAGCCDIERQRDFYMDQLLEVEKILKDYLCDADELDVYDVSDAVHKAYDTIDVCLKPSKWREYDTLQELKKKLEQSERQNRYREALLDEANGVIKAAEDEIKKLKRDAVEKQQGSKPMEAK